MDRCYWKSSELVGQDGIPNRLTSSQTTEMPSYPYEPGCESRTDSLLTPGMDNTRHFYSWSYASCEPYIRLSEPTFGWKRL